MKHYHGPCIKHKDLVSILHLLHAAVSLQSTKKEDMHLLSWMQHFLNAAAAVFSSTCKAHDEMMLTCSAVGLFRLSECQHLSMRIRSCRGAAINRSVSRGGRLPSCQKIGNMPSAIHTQANSFRVSLYQGAVAS